MDAPAELVCTCASLRLATRAVSRIYDDELAPAGLRTTQYSILARLRCEGPATVGRLAARLGMDRSTLSREVAPLCERGLVKREPGADRRQTMLELTPAGRAAFRGARPAWERAQARIDGLYEAGRAEALRSELYALVLATGRAERREQARLAG